MDSRAERDAKLEELKRLKSRNKIQAASVVPEATSSLVPTAASLNPVLTKPEALPPIENRPEVKKPVIPAFAKRGIPPAPRVLVKPVSAPLNPFGSLSSKEPMTSKEDPEASNQSDPGTSVKPSEITRPSAPIMTAFREDVTETIEPNVLRVSENLKEEKNEFCTLGDAEIIDIDDLMIESLKKQLDVLEIAEKQLKVSTSRAQEENRRLKEEKENFDVNMENLRRVSEDMIKSLDFEYEKISQKMRKLEENHGFPNKNSMNKEIQELADELDFFSLRSEEKEEEIERLKKEIQKATDESKSLMIEGTHLSQPEPPPPVYNPVIEPHMQMPRRLLSDMGSTGAWNNKKKKP
jgi:hypothetical protein